MTLTKTPKIKLIAIFTAAFILPIAVLLACYYLMGFLPFGDKSLLIMDMSDQYVEFYAGLRDILLCKTSALYSWNIGFGANITGLVSYYLSSPFSVITALFPNGILPVGITVLTLLKIGLSSLAFNIFLRLKYNKTDIFSLLFSLMYALCGYAVGYAMCLMWIDSMIWLPMIILSLERLIKGKTPFVFIVFLFLEFTSNYYTAYMIGIFCVLYFIYYTVAEKIRISIKTVCKFIFSAVLAGGMSAFLILPTLFCMLSGKLGGAGYSYNKAVYYNPLLLAAKLMNQSSYDSITYDGTPFIYVGLLALLMLVVFFTLKRITLREKLASAGLISVIILTSVFSKLDLVWHAFKYPNWFPFRYMFVLAFFIIMCSYKAFCVSNEEKRAFDAVLKYILSFAVICLIFLLAKILFDIKTEIVALNILLIALCAVLICLKFIRNKAVKIISAVLLFAVCIFDVTSNTLYIYNSLDSDFGYVSSSKYSEFKQELTPIIDNIKKSDNDFYRIVKTFERSKNDAFGLNINGIGHYSSSYDRNTNKFLKKLGFAQDYFWCSYFGSTPLTDTLFGVKYLLSNDEVCNMYSVFSAADTENGVTAYKNPYALPVGFMADSKVKSYKTSGNNPFVAQSALLSAVYGDDVSYFKPIDNISATLHNCTQLNSGNYKFVNNLSDAYLSLNFKSDGNPVYAYFPVYHSNGGNAKLFVNNKFVCNLFTSDTERIIYLGNFENNAQVDVKIPIFGEVSFDEWEIYSLDLNSLFGTTEKISENSLNVTEHSGRYIKGTVKVNNDRTTMFTSIRYDEGWSVYVDGEKIAAASIDDTLMCFDLTVGTHTVELKYSPRGFKAGIVISAVSILIFIAAILITKQKRYKRT